MSRKKVLVGMSGGIDSSVSAYLLKERGYDVQGVTMTLWNKNRKYTPDEKIADACFSPNEVKDVEKSQEICRKLSISHTVLDISDDYEKIVLENFKNEYAVGRTPNPCVLCNEKIKFGAMVDYARKNGLEFDYFATGHYARIVNRNGRYAIARAVDEIKDQSYFLYRLSQRQIAGVIFPLGNMTKKQVRKIDLECKFHPAGQSESMDFYSGDYTDLLDMEPKEGNIVDMKGNVLGRHNGFFKYTLGQRKGLGIGGSPHPLYVVAINPEKNEVVVAGEEYIRTIEITAQNLSYMALSTENVAENQTFSAFAKVRSVGKPLPCEYKISEGRLFVKFVSPLLTPPAGQSVVIYDENGLILLGGIIA